MRARVYYYLGVACSRLHLWGCYQWFMEKSVNADHDGRVWTNVEDEMDAESLATTTDDQLVPFDEAVPGDVPRCPQTVTR